MGDLVPEKVFFHQLYDKGFKPTGHVDGDLRVWEYKNQKFIIPLPDAEDSEQGFYCSKAVERFFQHVFTSSALSDPHDQRFYNVVVLDQKRNPTIS